MQSEGSVENKVIDVINEFEKTCQASVSHLKKVRDLAIRSKKALSTRSSPVELEKLLRSIQGLVKEPQRPNLPSFVEQLQKLLPELRRGLVPTFQSELQRLCTAENLVCRPHGDGLGIGPFLLTIDAARERVIVSYGKANLAELPLVALDCISQLKQLQADIVDQPTDLGKCRTYFEEAMRVAVARKNKLSKGELRVDLPQLFREVQFIKQGDPSQAKLSYTLARFVVELSRLVRSDQNLDSKQPLRLETAVLENTKDSRRSVFLPKDLTCGYGEGTYFQALLMPVE